MSEKRRVAVLGSAGQLGSDLIEVLGSDDACEVLPLTRSQCDCANPKQMAEVLDNLHPDVVIDCAAYVRVDDCENHAAEAFGVNAVGALNVARACAAMDALCVYISSDYVFDGAKGAPYVESDPPCPINVYGASKLAGEHLVRQTAPRWLILRMASLFGKTGARGKGGNFVETIIRKAKAGEPLRVIDDITMSPTYARDASRALAQLLRGRTRGIVHVTNSGACTWYEFAKSILEFIGLDVAVVPVSSKEFPSAARRPKNSALQSEYEPMKSPLWQDALKAYLLEKGHVTRGGV